MTRAKEKQQSYFCQECKELLEKCQCDNSTESEHKSSHQCASWGCPLDGTNLSGSKWFCTWHFRNPVTMANAITAWANRNCKLITAERRLSTLGIITFGIQRKRWAKASIPPKPNESYFAYLGRLSAAVGETFHAEVHKQPANHKQGESHELPI